MAVLTQSERKKLRDAEKDYERSKERLAPVHTIWKELEELYFSQLKNTSNPWKSTIFDPESYEKVERMTSHVISTPPKGSFLPQETSDTFSVEIADQYFQYQWNLPKMEMFKKMMDMEKMAGIFGISYGLLTWLWDRREQKLISGKTKFLQLWDCWFLKALDPRDVFPDPAAIDRHTMQWVIINQYFTIEELEGQNSKFANGDKRYINLTLLKEKIKNKKDVVATQEDSKQGMNNAQGRGTSLGVRDRILVRTRFSRSEWYSWCPDYNIPIEDHANPYDHFDLPIEILIDQNVPGRLEGMGEIEPIRALQKGLNTVINQRLDNVRLILNTMFKVKQGAQYSYTFKSEPGAKWIVDNMDDVEPFSIPDVTGNMFQSTVNYFKDAISKTTGNTDILTQGPMQGGVRTASEINLANEEQNARLKSKEMFMDQFIISLCTHAMMLNQQYAKEKQIIRVVGVDTIQKLLNSPKMQETDPMTGRSGMKQVIFKGKEVPKLNVDSSGNFGFLVVEPEDIAGQFDFVAETGSTAAKDKSQEVTNTITLVDLLTKNQPLLMQEGKTLKLATLLSKVIGDLVPSVKNPDQIIGDAPPPMMQPNNLLNQQNNGQIQGQAQPRGTPGVFQG